MSIGTLPKPIAKTFGCANSAERFFFWEMFSIQISIIHPFHRVSFTCLSPKTNWRFSSQYFCDKINLSFHVLVHFGADELWTRWIQFSHFCARHIIQLHHLHIDKKVLCKRSNFIRLNEKQRNLFVSIGNTYTEYAFNIHDQFVCVCVWNKKLQSTKTKSVWFVANDPPIDCTNDNERLVLD